jgi:hypothetical protein
MNSMTQPSPLKSRREPSRPWLAKHYDATRQRTVSLVRATVDHLVRQGQAVTIEAICQQSQQFDALGKGIKKAGILGNVEAYAYYRQYRTHRSAEERKTHSSRRSAPTRSLLPTSLHRDLQQVRRRYGRESKRDLVERLVTVEQAYLESQEQLARLQFEILEQQQHMQKGQENASF